MLALLKIYFLFILYYILTQCDLSQSTDDLSVRIVDKKLIERKRQDTRNMCKWFNSEAITATDALPFNKYDKRKKELKLKEKKEELQQIKTHRVKRAVNSVNPALNVEDEERVETIVDKIYDDLLEKGQKIAYRRKGMPKAEVKSNISAANKSGRRFPFAPVRIDGPELTSRKPMPEFTKLARFDQGIVPYFIDSRTYDTHLSERIRKAFDYFEKMTCIRLQRLRERPTDQKSLQNVTWLYITNPSGIQQCVHSNERAEIKGVQMIVFGYDCMSLGDITHEIMHVLGFAHEHLRPDRDKHITILWDNIKPGYRKYFEVHDSPFVGSLPYDYASVMHYPPRAFSKNGQITILTKPGIKIGQREGLSEMDVEKIGMIYSSECINRTREYLLKTCPSVGQSDMDPEQVTQNETDDYFQDRLWPYGVVNYKLKDQMEFSSEEIENINAVITHIEKETCVEFRDLTGSENEVPDVVLKTQLETSASDNSSSGELDRLVILSDSVENETEYLRRPDTSTPRRPTKVAKKIIDPHIKHQFLSVKTVRKGVKGKNISGVKGKAANTDGKEKNLNINIGLKGKDANIGAKEKDANIGAMEKDANLGVMGKDANIGAKKRTANVPRRQSVLRKKRAVPPPPSRRHANSILVLARSPQPGCQCPQPGKPNGSYVLKINTDCFNSVNDLLHLFVHVLGLDHQHNMHDRDSYLHIVWDQLTEDVKQEMKRKLPPAASVGFPYDYKSVMHYPWLQIKNGITNIMYPIWNDGWEMGHWQGLSVTDVQKINLLYIKQCLVRKQQTEQVQNKAVNPVKYWEDNDKSVPKSDSDDESTKIY